MYGQFLRNSLKIVVFGLASRLPRPTSLHFVELYASLEQSGDKFANLVQLQHTIILQDEKVLLRTHPDELPLKFEPTVLHWQILRKDDVGVMRIVLAIVARVVVVGNVVALVDGLQH